MTSLNVVSRLAIKGIMDNIYLHNSVCKKIELVQGLFLIQNHNWRQGLSYGGLLFQLRG